MGHIPRQRGEDLRSRPVSSETRGWTERPARELRGFILQTQGLWWCDVPVNFHESNHQGRHGSGTYFGSEVRGLTSPTLPSLRRSGPVVGHLICLTSRVGEDLRAGCLGCTGLTDNTTRQTPPNNYIVLYYRGPTPVY